MNSVNKSANQNKNSGTIQEDKGDKKKEKKSKGESNESSKNPRSVLPELDENKLRNSLIPLKAITLYSAAKTLGLNASVTTAILRYLEAKGTIQKVAGYSGHYVWKMSGKT